jgi:hypothetical protein
MMGCPLGRGFKTCYHRALALNANPPTKQKMLNEGAYKASQEQRKGHNTLTIGSTLAEKKQNEPNE